MAVCFAYDNCPLADEAEVSNVIFSWTNGDHSSLELKLKRHAAYGSLDS
jgi:hypothetical protein